MIRAGPEGEVIDCVTNKANISENGGAYPKLDTGFLFHLSDAHGITVKVYTDERW